MTRGQVVDLDDEREVARFGKLTTALGAQSDVQPVINAGKHFH